MPPVPDTSASKPPSFKEVDKSHRHKCLHCPYASYTAKAIAEHVRSSHSTTPKEFKCSHCTYSSNYEQRLFVHLQLHGITNEQLKKPGDKHKCPHCPYVALTAGVITEHVRLGHSTTPKEFKCSHCTYSSSKQQFLSAHLKLHKTTNAQLKKSGDPTSTEPEPQMPRPQRRPLSCIGNASSASATHGIVKPLRRSSVAFPLPKRVASAAASLSDDTVPAKTTVSAKSTVPAETTVVMDEAEPLRSRRSQFEAEKKKQGKEMEEERSDNGLDATVAAVGRGASVKRGKKGAEKKKEIKPCLNAFGLEEEAVEDEQEEEEKEEHTRSTRSTRASTATSEKSTPCLGKRTRSSGKREEKGGEAKEGKPKWHVSVKNHNEEEEEKSVEEGAEPVKEVKRRGRKPLSAEENARRAEGRRNRLSSAEATVDTEDEEGESKEEQKKEVKRRGRKPLSAEEKARRAEERRLSSAAAENTADTEDEEVHGEAKEERKKEAKRRGPKPLSAEEKARRAEERRNRLSIAAAETTVATEEEKTKEEEPMKKRPRSSFADMKERARKMAEQPETVTVATRNEMELSKAVAGEAEKEEEEEDDLLDTSLLDAAIAQAEANARAERERARMPMLEKTTGGEKEKGEGETTNRKRVRFAPLPEKHHATRMPAYKRRRMTDREGDAMRSTVARGFTSFISSLDGPFPSSSPSSMTSSGFSSMTSSGLFSKETSPDRSERRASILEAMKARASQLVQQDEDEAEQEWKEAEERRREIKLPPVFVPISETPRKRPPLDEFDSDYEEEPEREERRVQVEVPLPPPPKKTPVKARKSATVSPAETTSASKKKPTTAPRAKNTPVKNARNAQTTARNAQATARAAAAAARKKEQARAAKLRRLKRELARRLEKADDRKYAAARAAVEEEDRYWRMTKEVRPLEQREWSGEARLFSWPEIHNVRRRMGIDVEPRLKEGEKKELLHSISTSVYLVRSIELKKRLEVDGRLKVVKRFTRARSPPIDWSYEEKETEEALLPTVPALFVPGGAVRVL